MHSFICIYIYLYLLIYFYYYFRAKQSKRGIFSAEKPKPRSFVDLTEKFRISATDNKETKDTADLNQRKVSAKAHQFLQFLQKEESLNGVVEHVFSGTRLKVFVPKHNCMIFFVLSGKYNNIQIFTYSLI